MPHVKRDRQHVVAVVEERLGAVAVMHVPVDDRDAVEAVAARALRGERGVVDEAVAVGGAAARRGGPAGARARTRVAGAVEHGVRGVQGRAGGRQDRLPGAGRDERRAREVVAARAGRAQLGDVVAVVQRRGLLDRGVPAVVPSMRSASGPGAGCRACCARARRSRRASRAPRASPALPASKPRARVVPQHVVVPEDVEDRRHARRCTGECVSRQLHSLVGRWKCRCGRL